MLVLCYAMQESCSTLAFDLVRAVLQYAGHDQTFAHDDLPEPAETEGESHQNFVRTVTRDKISELIAAIGPQRKIAVQTHAVLRNEMLTWLEEMQAARDVQIVTSYRDPRDACLSLLDAGRKSRETGMGSFGDMREMDDAASYVQGRSARFRKWSAIKGALRLNYDTVAYKPDEAIAAIEGALGVTSDGEQVLQHIHEDAYAHKIDPKRHRYLEDMDAEQIDRLGVKFRRFILNACENDSQFWYDSCRMGVLKGGSDDAEEE